MRSSQLLSALSFILAIDPYRVEGAPTASQSHGLQGPASVVGNLSYNTPGVIREESSMKESAHAQTKAGHWQNLATKSVKWSKRATSSSVDIPGLSAKLSGFRGEWFDDIVPDGYRHNDAVKSGSLNPDQARAGANALRSRIGDFQSRVGETVSKAVAIHNGMPESEEKELFGDAIEDAKWSGQLTKLATVMDRGDLPVLE